MPNRRIIYGVLLTVLVVVFFAPTSAHAADPITSAFISFGSDFAGEIMKLVLALLDVVKQVLVQIIVWSGQVLNAIIGTELNYGGVAIYQVWKIFRDICNGAFIVLFILVAFGTIFNVTLKNNPFYYQTALMNVIIAALLINFSLPIGETIVWAGNKATALVNSTMGSKDVAAIILTKGQLPQVVVGKNGLALSQVPFTEVPMDRQNPVQQIATNTFTGEAQNVFEECRAGGAVPLPECSARAARVQAPAAAKAVDEASLKTDMLATLKRPFSDAVLYWSNAARGAVKGGTSGLMGGVVSTFIGASQGAWNGANLVPPPNEPAKQGLTEQALQIVSTMVNLFFLGVLAIGFAVVIAFMVARVPMIWFYLAMSALAFFSIGVPGSKLPKEWFKNMVGWNIFAPLYLFVIYIGMMVLSNESALLDGLKGAGTFSGLLGVTLFYVLTGGIFIFGAKAAWGYAFDWSDSLKNYVSGAADTLGVGEKSNFGASTLASKLGLTARYEARKAQVQQFGGDVATGFRARAPKWLSRTEEESVAYRKMKLGVRGAGAELDTLTKKRVETEKGTLEENISKRNLNQNQEIDYLRSQFQSGNRDVALAAGEMLLKKGKMNTTERDALLKKYGKVSPIARKAALGRIVEQYKKEEFKDAADAIDALGAVKEDDKAYKDLLKSIAKNQPLLYARLADQGVVFKDDGTKEKMSEVLERTASKLSDKELLELYKSNELKDLGENMKYVWQSKTKNQKDLQGILRISDKETRTRLRAELERGEQEERAPKMAEEAVQRQQEQVTLGEGTAAEIESKLSAQIRDLNSQGQAAIRQYNEARSIVAKDASNTAAGKIATDAQKLIQQIAAQRDQLKAKLERGTPPPTT